MSSSTDKTNAFYAPLFSRFTAAVGTGTPAVETQCLAHELSQIADVPEAALVLDAGCGTGRYSAAWKALLPGATIVGVDINRTILATGQVNPAALSRVTGTLERLPFADGCFDVVMSRGVIQHTANPRRALEELLRVCKPGGLLYFYTYRHGTYDVVLNQLRKLARGIGSPVCSRAVYGVCRMLRLDPRASTMILDELFVPIRFAFKEETIREWLRSSGVPLASIAPVEHAQFGQIDLPIDKRTAWIYRMAPKNGLITLAVRTRA
jgi:SAM-dependent methyltransferase